MVRTTSQGQVYLVTGGAGFIGSHLVEELLARGRRVLAIERMHARPLSPAADTAYDMGI